MAIHRTKVGQDGSEQKYVKGQKNGYNLDLQGILRILRNWEPFVLLLHKIELKDNYFCLYDILR